MEPRGCGSPEMTPLGTAVVEERLEHKFPCQTKERPNARPCSKNAFKTLAQFCRKWPGRWEHSWKIRKRTP